MAGATAAGPLISIGIGRSDAAVARPDPVASLRRAVERGAAVPARPPMPVPLLTLKPAPADLHCRAAAKVATDPALGGSPTRRHGRRRHLQLGGVDRHPVPPRAWHIRPGRAFSSPKDRS